MKKIKAAEVEESGNPIQSEGEIPRSMDVLGPKDEDLIF